METAYQLAWNELNKFLQKKREHGPKFDFGEQINQFYNIRIVLDIEIEKNLKMCE